MRHNFEFDPTYGYDLPRLLQVVPPAPPADFARFWQDTFNENAALPLELTCQEIAADSPAVRVYEVSFNSLDGFRTGGWITLPQGGAVTRGFVVGHGYGGRTGPDLNPPAPGAAAIFPCARGFNRSARPSLPHNGNEHVLVGIESRETYIHRGCVAEIWSAASALQEFVPAVGGRLDYIGGSFGGGIGALALAWDQRFRRAFLQVPSFGHHPVRVTCPCVGSGEAVRRHYQDHPGVLEVLAYFDAATAARFLQAEVLFACALFDPAVPPPGQFAVHNAAPGRKELFVQAGGHFTFAGQPEEDQRLNRRIKEWFA